MSFFSSRELKSYFEEIPTCRMQMVCRCGTCLERCSTGLNVIATPICNQSDTVGRDLCVVKQKASYRKSNQPPVHNQLQIENNTSTTCVNSFLYQSLLVLFLTTEQLFYMIHRDFVCVFNCFYVMWNVFILFYLCMYFVRNDEIKLWYILHILNLSHEFPGQSPTNTCVIHPTQACRRSQIKGFC